MKPTTLSFLALLLTAATAPTTDAQCSVDGFDAGCCLPVTPNFPSFFPPINTQAQTDCWDACGAPVVGCAQVSTSPLFPQVRCGEFGMQLTVLDCTGAPMLSGLVNLMYSRNWEEEPAPFERVQVWRFLAKVDLERVPGVPPTCPIPNCAVGTNRVFYYGHVDYAFDCGTGTVESSLVLFHGCDDFTHNPAYSSVPGTYHPTESFAIIAPDTTANPFVATPIPTPPLAALTNEAMRSTPATPPLCVSEERLNSGLWAPILDGCLCPFSLAPPQNTVAFLEGESGCGGGFTTLNFWPIVPWFGLVKTSLGTWTTSASYPGEETASVAEGLFLYNDGCSTSQSLDIMYGSLTTGGYPVLGPPPPLTPLGQNFLDLASNYSSPFPGPISTPLFGSVEPTEHLIYVNP